MNIARTDAQSGMKFRLLMLIFALVMLSSTALADAPIPDRAPRTMVLAAKQSAFRDYCTTGEGAKAFAKIKSDFNKDYLALPFPDEPVTYGDPDPKQRDSAKA